MLCLVKRLLRAQHDKQVSFRKICFFSKDHEQTAGYTDDEMDGLILPVLVECMVTLVGSLDLFIELSQDSFWRGPRSQEMGKGRNYT